MQKTKYRSLVTGKTAVLNASLMWFSIGLLAMLSVATIFGLIPQMQEVSIELFASRGFVILLSIAAIGLMLLLIFTSRTARLEVLAAMFVAFALVEGFSLAMLLIRFAFAGET